MVAASILPVFSQTVVVSLRYRSAMVVSLCNFQPSTVTLTTEIEAFLSVARSLLRRCLSPCLLPCYYLGLGVGLGNCRLEVISKISP